MILHTHQCTCRRFYCSLCCLQPTFHVGVEATVRNHHSPARRTWRRRQHGWEEGEVRRISKHREGEEFGGREGSTLLARERINLGSPFSLGWFKY